MNCSHFLVPQVYTQINALDPPHTERGSDQNVCSTRLNTRSAASEGFDFSAIVFDKWDSDGKERGTAEATRARCTCIGYTSEERLLDPSTERQTRGEREIMTYKHYKRFPVKTQVSGYLPHIRAYLWTGSGVHIRFSKAPHSVLWNVFAYIVTYQLNDHRILKPILILFTLKQSRKSWSLFWFLI